MNLSNKVIAYNESKNKLRIINILFNFLKEIFKNKTLYAMAVPALVLLFLFNYFPLFGLIIAFKDYQFDKGIFGSQWMKPLFYNFQFLFDSSSALRAIRNTLLLNFAFITIGVVTEVGFALMLNEIGCKWFKKTAQLITFLPYFISWIVVGVFVYNLFSSEHGAINGLLSSLGMREVDWYFTPGAWPIILILINRWKNTGYGCIMYLSTLTGIDSSYYEAANIDGATRWQQIRYISLPLLWPTIIVLVLLQLGKIMNADFGMFYATVGDASTLYPTTDVIDTFVYRALRITGDIGMASATGLVQSVLSFILVIGSNMIVKKIDEDSSLF
ncbi:MAG TPA: sugar ABC transporter permease [Clostridiaceae bacterium]|nr:sugar ABC transporter permease [Clostridiaceae bacterium]